MGDWRLPDGGNPTGSPTGARGSRLTVLDIDPNPIYTALSEEHGVVPVPEEEAPEATQAD